MELKGKVINKGKAEGMAVVLDSAFSFIGDMDPKTGELTMTGSPLAGQSLAGKILVFPTGKGGTIAPFIAYLAQNNGVAPCAILCDKVEPITAESAMVINIPLMDSFSLKLTDTIKTHDKIKIDTEKEMIEIISA
jgi:hypothetical protein